MGHEDYFLVPLPGSIALFTSLLITEGESSATLVLRVVPFLVVDGKIGTLGSPFLPIVDKLQQEA